MKIILYIIIIAFVVNCGNQSPEKLMEVANNHRVKTNLREAVISLKSIIDQFPQHDFAAEAQFQIADIYLNDVKDFEFAIVEFKKVIKQYPNHDVAKKSLFMIAYIYNNYLNAYTESIKHYKSFKLKYPEDELIPSVDFELESLKAIESTIDSLNLIINKKSTS